MKTAHVIEYEPPEDEGGVGGFDWDFNAEKVDKREAELKSLGVEYTIHRHSIEVADDMTGEAVTDYIVESGQLITY